MDVKRLEVDLPMGLDDSEFVSYNYEIKKDVLILMIQSWNARAIKFLFYDVIQFVDKGSYGISIFCELLSDSPFLKDALKNIYETIPESHPFRTYQFLDLDDEASFEIICKNYEIIIS